VFLLAFWCMGSVWWCMGGVWVVYGGGAWWCFFTDLLDLGVFDKNRG
jgi:hypothetical protein